MFRLMKPQYWPLLLLVCALLVAGSAIAGDTPAPTLSEETIAGGVTTKAMTAEHEAELRAFLAPRLNRSDAGLVETVDADGGISMDPRGGFQNVMLARVAPDGTVEVGCFDELEAAMRFLKFENAPPLPDHETAAE